MSQTSAKLHTDLIARLQQGEQHAWEQFVAEWGPRLYNYMCYNLPTMADVDAVLGRTMQSIVASVPRYDEALSFEAFIYSVAFREVAYFYHHRRQSGTLAILESAGRHRTDGAAEVDPGRFYETLAQLPDQSRQAMLLRYRVGFSVDEVARILGQSYNATCSLLRQGQRHFGMAGDDTGAKAA